MNSRLKPGERCPIHKSFVCCGREDVGRLRKSYSGPVKKLDDGRELCSPAELRRRKHKLLSDGEKCAACGGSFDSYSEVELAHKISKGFNGGKRDDSWRNLCLMHKSENREMGSRTLPDYLAWRAEKGLAVFSLLAEREQ